VPGLGEGQDQVKELLKERLLMIPDDLRILTNAIYVVDQMYNIVDYNDGYKMFAIENDGEDILDRWPIGSNIMSSIPEILRDTMKRMYDDVILNKKIIEHEYDCHSATVFRRFKMRILPFMNGFALHEHCQIESSQLNGAYELSDGDIESGYVDKNGLVHQCCHCRRIQSCTDGNNWVWVISLINRNRTFAPRISHTICPVCMLHHYPDE
jgi:hypothetical protein